MTTTPAVDFGPSIDAAKDQGVSLLTDNVSLLLAMPVIWVGVKVARKIIAKFS